APLKPEAFRIRTIGKDIIIAGADLNGTLYGTFTLLRMIAAGEPLANLNIEQSPHEPIRWVNHWDNLDGTIERGYGGRSIFWDNGTIRADLTRVNEYGRLLASVGINACSINNVNANIRAYDTPMLPELKRVAAAFRPWGVRMALSLDFGSPKSLGGLDTFDPADPRVIKWWADKVDEIYAAIPDLAGFVLKADSEGRVGPSAYGRTHADAANVIARPTKRHGGVLFYRGFVYDHHMDWRNLKNDRARAAYDNLHPLDGQFDDNVIVQIKHGPIDFQVREPVSPLFAGMPKTRKSIELQITQEYFGQGRHTVFLVPMWKEALDFDMRVDNKPSPLKSLVQAFAGVSNVGLDDNWFGNNMSQANLYGYGRLAWNPDLSSKQIIDEWTRLTFRNQPRIIETISKIQLESWHNYENFSGNLGLQTLTEMTGTHYGPSVEASERNGWGQWHRSDANGSGMDRTVATGTGYIGQYPPEVAHMYESLKDCPDDLLLFMHHVPYTYKLHSGKTVIQHIYDAHYEGAAAAQQNVPAWKRLRGMVDERRYDEVLAQLEYQAGHAEEWRDSIVSWFLKTTGIPDATGRAGHYPGRIEAEAMTLDGYTPSPAKPWETASGGTAIECPRDKCNASFEYSGDPGWRIIEVRYFDRIDGVSHFKVSIAGQPVDEWIADDHFPSRKLDGASSTRRLIGPIDLHRGDRIEIEGIPGGPERAPLDYVELMPVHP
ncbi:MAG TPA: glucosiduronase, partial [Bryobacteraceae bacterium]